MMAQGTTESEATPNGDHPTAVRVAVDAGPLHGHRTGVGITVASTLVALQRRDDIDLIPYVTSMRAKVSPPERRLQLPAALAHRMWRRDLPRSVERFVSADRRLGRPEIVHGTNYVVPPADCPRVVTVHDCWFLEHPELADPVVVRAGEVLRRAVDNGAHVIAVSNATAAKVRELLGTSDVTRIHHGLPSAPMDPAPRRPDRFAHLGDVPFVLSVGTLERRKNIPTLIRAFDRVANEHETARLVLAGAPGDDRTRIAAAIESLPSSTVSRIHQVGPVDSVEKDWLVRTARVLAYPSLDEGFGVPILEAQRAGTPVVTSTAGAIPEVAGSAALFSTPTDADAIAANLFWVLTSNEQYATLASRGKANLRRFSWDRNAEQHVQLYRRLARSN